MAVWRRVVSGNRALLFSAALCGCVSAGCDGRPLPLRPASSGGGQAGGGGTDDRFTEWQLPANAGPLFIVAGPDGNVWFTEPGRNAIGRMTPRGVLAEFFSPTPAGSPQGITTGSDGNLWFTVGDHASAAVGRITPTGAIDEVHFPTNRFAAPEPYFIARGLDDDLWLTDPGIAIVVRLTIDLAFVDAGAAFTRYQALEAPGAVAEGPDGNMWFTSDLWIVQQLVGGPSVGYPLPHGSPGSPSGANAPLGLAAGPDGNLWVAGNAGRRLLRIEFPVPPPPMSPRMTEIPLAHDGAPPLSITVGPDGNLWFTEDGPAIGRATPAGVVTEFSIPSGASAFAITTGADGALWFTEPAANRIARFGPPP